ncbi:MAG: amino acid permease [Spirochaetales bacterium]|nr:amino acid permease [Spirochaetales bacterium]
MNLKKDISLYGVFSIATGAMISSGIFILPSLAFARVGPALFLSYLLAGVLGLIGILSVIELTTAMPKAGGNYFAINKTFGPMVGTVSGILSWIALALKSAFAIYGISELIYIYTGFSTILSGLILTLLFVFVNIRGSKETVIFQMIMVTGMLVLMAVYVVLGIGSIDVSLYKGMFNTGGNQIIYTAGFVFVSFGGLLNVSNIAEEVKNPKRNIPLGIISSIVSVTVFYVLITWVLAGTLEPEAFRNSHAPVAESARNIIGLPGYLIIAGASTLAFFTTANGGIMSASRYPLALSRDKLAPGFLGRISSRFKTPVLSIGATGAIIFISLLLPLEMLVKAASTIILTSYVLTNIAVIIMRESKLKNYKPSFKAPLYPWLQIFSIGLFAFFIVDMGMSSIEISLAMVFVSFIIYMFFGRKVKNRETAILHLLRKLTEGKLEENLLEEELREIIISRDENEHDGLDRLLLDAVFIDIKEVNLFDQLLDDRGPDLENLFRIKKEEIRSTFIKSEMKSSFALSDFLAIPHISLPDSRDMKLLVVRSKEGIQFPGNGKIAHALFILGRGKEREHEALLILASLIDMAESDEFRKNWLSAENADALKRQILESERKKVPEPE